MEQDKSKGKDIIQAIDTLPGVEVNEADDMKNTPELRKQWTCELNNNPRNHKS